MSFSIKADFSSYLSVVYLSNRKPLFDEVIIKSDMDADNLTLRISTSPEYDIVGKSGGTQGSDLQVALAKVCPREG